MTISKAIEMLDELRPNAYDEILKTEWLSQLDGQFALETLKAPEFSGYSYPEDSDRELLIPAPYDGVYLYYLQAMLDYQNREYGNYANTMSMFNAAMDQYEKYLRRTNLPAQKNAITY